MRPELPVQFLLKTRRSCIDQKEPARAFLPQNIGSRSPAHSAWNFDRVSRRASRP